MIFGETFLPLTRDATEPSRSSTKAFAESLTWRFNAPEFLHQGVHIVIFLHGIQDRLGLVRCEFGAVMFLTDFELTELEGRLFKRLADALNKIEQPSPTVFVKTVSSSSPIARGSIFFLFGAFAICGLPNVTNTIAEPCPAVILKQPVTRSI